MKSVNNTNFYNGQYASTVYPIAEEEPEYTTTIHKVSRPPGDPYPTPLTDIDMMFIFCFVYLFFRILRKTVII